MPAYNQPPDLDDIPESKDGYMRGLYSETRRTRQMTENVFWILLVLCVIAVFAAGCLLYLADAMEAGRGSGSPAPARPAASAQERASGPETTRYALPP